MIGNNYGRNSKRRREEELDIEKSDKESVSSRDVIYTVKDTGDCVPNKQNSMESLILAQDER